MLFTDRTQPNCSVKTVSKGAGPEAACNAIVSEITVGGTNLPPR